MSTVPLPLFVEKLAPYSPAPELAGMRVLLVGTGGVKRTPVLRSIRRSGVAQVVCLNAASNWAAPFVDEWLIADETHVSEATFSLVRKEHGRRPFHAVFTYDDYSVVLAAELAQALELPGCAPAAARASKNKPLFRELCVRAGLPAPKHCVLTRFVNCGGQLAKAGLRYPVVFKPVAGGGSAYVRKVSTEYELEAAVAAYAAAVANDPVVQLWPDSSLLVEEFILGPEVDVDVLMQNGQCRYASITDNFAPPEGHFVEVGGQLPSSLGADDQRLLIENAVRTLRAIGFTDGCAHFESKLSPSGPVPIEANLRVGGAEVFGLHRAVHGVNLAVDALRIAVGVEVRPRDASNAKCWARSHDIHPRRSGVVRGVSLRRGLASEPALAELVLFRRPGEHVSAPPAGYDYLGWLVALGADAAAADRNAEDLAAAIEFDIAQEA